MSICRKDIKSRFTFSCQLNAIAFVTTTIVASAIRIIIQCIATCVGKYSSTISATDVNISSSISVTSNNDTTVAIHPFGATKLFITTAAAASPTITNFTHAYSTYTHALLSSLHHDRCYYSQCNFTVDILLLQTTTLLIM